MATDSVDGDYLGAYRRFFENFVAHVDPEDQLPVKMSGYDLTEAEISGEIMDWTLQYLNQKYCPPSLQSYLVHKVIEEVKVLCSKQPEACGWRNQESTYAPLRLMHVVINKVNEICMRYLDNSRLALLPPPPTTPIPFVSTCAIKNTRRKMEDRHVVVHDLHTIFSIEDDSPGSYYAVFDGHAGQEAAVYCAAHLHQYLAESIHYPTDPQRALRDAFLTTDAHFIEKSNKQDLGSGTTAVCILLLQRKLYVAWVGDSQAVLAKCGQISQLVNPHRPDRDDERQRVQEMGGSVINWNGWRVNGQLAVSRAIGNVQYKPYVTGDPEIRVISLDGTEDFLIIACDGLWDYVSEAMATTIVYQELDRNPRDLEVVTQHLVHYARNQGSADNISTIVVFLTDPRQIAARNPASNSLLANVPLNIMESNNPFLTNANGQANANLFGKQHNICDSTTDNDENNQYQRHFGVPSSNGKHANGASYGDDDDDLGPETDVDAVDEGPEVISTILDNLSRELFPEKSDDREKFPESDSPHDNGPRTTRSETDQNALIPDADNVADSEESEDEWNYYSSKETERAAEVEVEIDETKDDKVTSNAESTNEKINDHIDIQLPDTGRGDDLEIEKSELIESDNRADDKLKQEFTKQELEDMDFQLNPNAAEFVPVSPPITHPVLSNLNSDYPLSGSPQKLTIEMDDISIPSQGEFRMEACLRPHETVFENGASEKEPCHTEFTEYLMDRQKASGGVNLGLDESEISSTKAEFGDESTTSYLTATDFHRTGISTIDDSSIGSERDYDISKDPMAMSFTPGDFESAFDKPACDLNAVHQLTDTDLMGVDETTVADEEGLIAQSPDLHPELATLVTPDTDHPPPTPAFPHSQTDMQDLLDEFAEKEADALEARGPVSPEPLVPNESNLLGDMVEMIPPFNSTQQNIESDFKNVHDESVNFDNFGDRGNTSSPLITDSTSDVNVGYVFCSVSDKADHLLPSNEIDEPSASPISDPAADTEIVSSPAPAVEKEDLVTPSLISDEHSSSPQIRSPAPDIQLDFLVPDVVSSSHVDTQEINSSPVPPTDHFIEKRDLLEIESSDTDVQQSSVPSIEESVTTHTLITNDIDDLNNLLGTPVPETLVVDEKIAEPVSNKQPNIASDQSASVDSVPAIAENQNGISDVTEEKKADDIIELFASDKLEKESAQKEMEELTSPTNVEDSQSDFVLNLSASPLQPEETLQTEKTANFSSSPLPSEDPNVGSQQTSTVDADLLEAECDSTKEIIVPEAKTSEIQTVHEAIANSEPPAIEEPIVEKPVLNLSESMQEFTGLERELNPEVAATLLNAAAPESEIKPESQIQSQEKAENVIVEKVEKELTVPAITAEPKPTEATDPVVIAAVVAATAATTAAAGIAATGAVKATKTKPSSTKTTKTTTPAKTTTKSTPTSPIKAATTATRTTAAPPKKPTTGTATRPSTLKPAVSNPSTKSPATKSLTATKTTPNKVASPRASTLSAKPRPTSVSSAKPTTNSVDKKLSVASVDKKPTTNGDVKPASRPSAPKPPARTSSTTAASKPLVKTSTTTRPASASAAGTTTGVPKTRAAPTSALSARPRATTTATATAARPKTAPATTTTASKTRSPVTKSQITDKQTKETTNKQLSSARLSTNSTRTTARTTLTGTTSTLKRNSTNKTSATTTTTAAPPKKPAPITRPGGKLSAHGKTATKTATTTTLSSKTEVKENGVCEIVTETATSVHKTEEDIPLKDASPVILATDNQLIMSAD